MGNRVRIIASQTHTRLPNGWRFCPISIPMGTIFVPYPYPNRGINHGLAGIGSPLTSLRQPHVGHKMLEPLRSSSIRDRRHAWGSYIGVKSEAIYVPPPPCILVDTCCAGDAYASGILYGILRGASDLKGIGLLALLVAAVVVAQQGTRLRVQDADRLAESFAHHLDSLEFCSDVWIE
jgi:hypothetical protein